MSNVQAGVLRLLEQAEREELYGSIVVKLEKGRVTQIKREQTILPNQLSDVSRGKENERHNS